VCDLFVAGSVKTTEKKGKRKMKAKYILKVCTAAAMFSAGVYAQEAQEPVVQEEKETSLSDFVSAEASISIDSKYITYGLVDNNRPIVTPSATLTLFDFLYFGVSAIFDTTKYGKKAGYSNRGGRYTELYPEVGISYSFSPDDFTWLPTTVDFTLGYMYEYHPRAVEKADPIWGWGEDSQFVYAEIGLPDIPLEPVLYYERDIDRDNGTYVNLELGHTFALVDGESEEDDPKLDFRLSAAQGFGNNQRVRGYLDIDHGGLMDTCLKGTLTWRPCEYFEFSGYVAYYDFLFDRNIRQAAREYESTGYDESYNFVAGLCATVSF
jgi:hypothetical protein